MRIDTFVALLCRWHLLWGSYCRDGPLSDEQVRPRPHSLAHTLAESSMIRTFEAVETIVGLGKDQFLSRESPTANLGVDVEEDGKAEAAHIPLTVNSRLRDTSTVFTISPQCDNCANLCLDYVQGGGQNFLQLWQCNGRENQLWYFDSGKYEINWGGDRTMCVDAGNVNAGNTLFLWKCNGMKQQTWGYDSQYNTIYLTESETNAKYCMDLKGASTNLGTPVQLWNCNGLWEQKWNLVPGITLRITADFTLCLDIAGGKYDNGTPLQLWKCNGHINQKWFFENYKLKSASNPNKCIDAGNPVNLGTHLMIWDCNNLPQQNFGYDGNDFTIYLSNTQLSTGGDSSKLGAPQASLCVDVLGGQLKEGTPVDVWDCNHCWNQQFNVIGPVSNMAGEERQLRTPVYSPSPSMVPYPANVAPGNRTLKSPYLEDGCPNKPSPTPTPSPSPTPSSYILPHCEQGDQHGWPTFATQADLQASKWAKYFQIVYGEVPSTGYPICTYGLSMLYKPVLSQAQVQLPTLQTSCPSKAGTYYARMSGFPITVQSWIYNPNLPHPSSGAVPGNKWVEVLHSAFSMDGSATWFYYAPGTAIFMYTGNTKVYNDHPDAIQDLLKQQCADNQKECGKQFDAMYKAALAQKLDSLQFTQHADMQCDTGNNDEKNLAIEIVDLKGPGTTTCSQTNSGNTRFRAGWEAKSVCVCDNTDQTINCAGYGVKR